MRDTTCKVAESHLKSVLPKSTKLQSCREQIPEHPKADTGEFVSQITGEPGKPPKIAKKMLPILPVAVQSFALPLVAP